MRRNRNKNPRDQIEEQLRRAGSIGKLEHLAGIGPSEDARNAFWQRYARLPDSTDLDAGVAQLKQRIRAQAATRTRTKQPHVSAGSTTGGNDAQRR